MRKMATVRAINGIRPIPNADRICTYVIDGWTIVDRINAYDVGDKVVMCEIDSWVPHTIAPFLSGERTPDEYEGVLGKRVKTAKLRGQISQGLILPISVLPTDVNIGTDVSELLNIKKYERPIPASLQGDILGDFPSRIRKTDQERIQNIDAEVLANWIENGLTFEITEKLDGTSSTFYFDSEIDTFGSCSRNLELKENDFNTYWKIAHDLNLQEILVRDGRSLAIQGEIVGNGIQRNHYKISGHKLFVFDIFDMKHGKYLSPEERRHFCSVNNLNHVPVIDEKHTIVGNVQALIEMADGVSNIVDSRREGIVFKCNDDSDISFKCISNKWLLKNEE